jgi:hypothetical protein
MVDTTKKLTFAVGEMPGQSVHQEVSWEGLTAQEQDHVRETHRNVVQPEFQHETAVHEALHKYYMDRAGVPARYVPCHLIRLDNGHVWLNVGQIKTDGSWQSDGVALFKGLLAPSVAQRNERLRKIFGFTRDTDQFFMDLEQARTIREDLNTRHIGSGTYLRKRAIGDLLDELETEQVQTAVLEEAERAKKLLFGNLPF